MEKDKSAPKPIPRGPEPRIIEGRNVINESEDEEDSQQRKIPDSGSTEQYLVKSALNDDGDYYDEHRSKIER